MLNRDPCSDSSFFSMLPEESMMTDAVTLELSPFDFSQSVAGLEAASAMRATMAMRRRRRIQSSTFIRL